MAVSHRMYLLAFTGGRQLHRKRSLHQPGLSVRAVVLMAPIEWRLCNFSDFAFQLSPFHFPSQRQISLRFSETSHVTYTGCNRRNGPNFGRVFLMLNYTDITQNTYVQR